MKKGVVLSLLFACCAGLLNAAEKMDNSGWVVCNGKKLVITDVVATWNAKNKEMQVYFYPFKLNTADLKKVKSGKAWLVGFGKKSPDKKLWASWCPNAQLKINFSQVGPSLKSASFCNFMFFGLTKNNYTANLNKNGNDVQKNIQKLIVKTNKLFLKSKGSGKLFKEEYSWELSASCPVFDIKEQ